MALVCGFCAQGIEKTLRKNPATSDVFVSLGEPTRRRCDKTDRSDIERRRLRKALQDAGYDVKAITRTNRSLDELRKQAKQSP